MFQYKDFINENLPELYYLKLVNLNKICFIFIIVFLN